MMRVCYFFFFNDPATTEIYTLSLPDALPICEDRRGGQQGGVPDHPRVARRPARGRRPLRARPRRQPRLVPRARGRADAPRDRKSTRLNSSHANISYAVFCLKKKIIYTLITLS